MKKLLPPIAMLALIGASLFFLGAAQKTYPPKILDEIGKDSIEVWKDGLPEGSKVFSEAEVAKLKEKEKKNPQHITFVRNPSLTVYPANPERANGTAVIICPGGGYNILAWPKEGLEIAEWFNSIGVTAFVLKYRVPRRQAPDKIHWEPMQDVQRAIRLIRHEANNGNKYGIKTDRIGVLGFSAGGHLTVMSGLQYNTKCYEPKDKADQESARPNFMCPIYAAYLGDDFSDDKAELGSLITVDKDTPQTFMAVTADDRMRGAQAALLFVRLREHGVPAELHVYSQGGHGYGMRPSNNPVAKWGDRLEEWLKVRGFLDR